MLLATMNLKRLFLLTLLHDFYQMRLLNKFTALRDSEKLRLSVGNNLDGYPFKLGDITTVNITKLKAGIQHNVRNCSFAVVLILILPISNSFQILFISLFFTSF